MSEYNLIQIIADALSKEKKRRTVLKLPIATQIMYYFDAVHEYDGDYRQFDLYEQIYKQHKKSKGVVK